MTRSDRPAAIVTGAGSGIGLASARSLAAAGYNLVINGRRKHLLEEAAAAIVAAVPGAAVEIVGGSVAEPGDVDAIFARAVDAYGRLDAVVSAAAALHVANFKDLTLADWDEMNATVLRGAAMIAMAATKSFLATRTRGRIVFISSISARVADPGLAHYCAAKAGVDALVRSLAVDLSADGIVANSVAPGWIHTPMIGEFVDSLQPGALAVMNPQARAADPDEVARIVRFLVAEAPDFLTGTTITVDGGQTVMNHVI
ncbi:SDR family oxidoreductase [Mesorhizobium sp. CU2]|uniref:SDR family NAD(P)-dependent oxidoreductase n=1 Tax=unclassified Mesorhizobium TaxID=325217 RepID=UPI00112C239B|nr:MULTISPECIES: SDR family oxidoreductase [unclassified Mesorhizobium]TPN85644.1 SDR family oxidoreductase [Mesorhizobium sp. CU3]TPO11001.1 SDR family oxidoreductase [Mesorhizobium sp. CU2]